MTSAQMIPADVETAPGPQPARNGNRRFAAFSGLKSPKIVAGFVIVIFFALVAILGPLIIRTDPSQVSNSVLDPPSFAHLLGTTQSGQDLFAQMIAATRSSMYVGFVAAVLSTALSILVGLLAGYLGGMWDEVLSLVTNIFLVIPGLPLAVIMLGYLPGAGSLSIIIVIAITGWAWSARLLRAQTFSIRKREFIAAARLSGEGTFRIIALDIVPNQLAIIASSFFGTVIAAILTQAGLAFLGLTNVTEWSWGTILYWAQSSGALLLGAWWWYVPAGLAIALVGTGLSLINFGIDEFVNPRLRVAGLGTRKSRRLDVAPSRRRRGLASLGAQPEPGSTRGLSQPVRTAAPEDRDVILDIRHLQVDYATGPTPIKAVNDVSLKLRRGSVLGIAGESGSGKSTLAYAITRLHKPPAEIPAGELVYTNREGEQVDILKMSDAELRKFRWADLSIAFQSAMNALNPILRIGAQLKDVIVAHEPGVTKAELETRVTELLQLVGISPDRANAYPHELSGGMRQRVMIAIALALNPEIVVMDEPTTALDVVIQRQIIEKIIELKDRLGFSVIFITHDLSLLVELCDEIAVMYAGRVIEVASASNFYRDAKHPYSQGLLNSFPKLSGPKRELVGIPGSPPDLRQIPSGCAFRTRCPFAFDACSGHVPPLIPVIGTTLGEGMKPSAHAASTGETGTQPEAQPTVAACLLYDPQRRPGAAPEDEDDRLLVGGER
jgi:oligopeptide/dipeptide ABC transporter ATP-binding protein